MGLGEQDGVGVHMDRNEGERSCQELGYEKSVSQSYLRDIENVNVRSKPSQTTDPWINETVSTWMCKISKGRSKETTTRFEACASMARWIIKGGTYIPFILT